MDTTLTTTQTTAQATSLISTFTSSIDVRPTTRKTYSRLLTMFILWAQESGRQLTELTAADIVAYKEHLLATRSTSTAATAIVAIRQLFDWVEEQGGRNIAKKVHTPKVKKTFVKQHLTPTEARQLIAAAKTKRDRAIMVLMLTTGLREVEVTRLNVGDVVTRHIVTESGEEVTRKVAKVWGKGRDAADAMVVIPAATWEVLREYLSTRYITAAEEPLFVGEGNKNKGGRLTTRSIQIIVTTAMHAIGLEGKEYSTHSLRHTAAVAALRNGSSLSDVQTMLRHASPETTQIYIESIKDELRLTCAAEDKATAYLGI